MLQVRPQGGGTPYAPFRDLVNAFPQIARRAAYCLAKEFQEQWFATHLRETGVTEDQLGQAAVSVARYINECRKPDLASPTQVLDAAGFSALPVPAQMAILAKIGQVTMAMYYACSRDALRIDEKPYGLDKLLQLAEEVESALGSHIPGAVS